MQFKDTTPWSKLEEMNYGEFLRALYDSKIDKVNIVRGAFGSRDSAAVYFKNGDIKKVRTSLLAARMLHLRSPCNWFNYVPGASFVFSQHGMPSSC
jgi:hypothetical protein